MDDALRKLGPCPEGYIRFTGVVKAKTSMAKLVTINNIDYWIPKSQCKTGIDPTGNRKVVDIKEWLVKKNNIGKKEEESKSSKLKRINKQKQERVIKDKEDQDYKEQFIG